MGQPLGAKVVDSINYLRKQNLDSIQLPAKIFLGLLPHSPLPLRQGMPRRHHRYCLRFAIEFDVFRSCSKLTLAGYLSPSFSPSVLGMAAAMCPGYNCLIVSIYFYICAPNFRHRGLPACVCPRWKLKKWDLSSETSGFVNSADLRCRIQCNWDIPFSAFIGTS